MFDPGERWQYGGSIDWVGRIVQAVSGEPLDVHFRRHIFEPLGMNDTSFVISPAQWKREARQAEAKNAITAMSKTAAYRDKVELRVQASGANAQRQIEQINAMIQAGADAIVAFPISPTALNGVIKTACDKKVVFVAVNGVTEPCAYNVKIDGVKHGAKQAKWVFEAIGGKGNVVYITGVPGVSYSEDYGKGVMETAKNYPGVHITGTLVGMWDQSLARVKMKEFLATRTWDDIDGVIAATGCYTISQMQVEDGRWPGKPIIP